MSDVDREALHDWMDERDALAADERPHPSEYADLEPDEFVCDVCGHELLPHEGPVCRRCEPDAGSATVDTCVCLASLIVWALVIWECCAAVGT